MDKQLTQAPASRADRRRAAREIVKRQPELVADVQRANKEMHGVELTSSRAKQMARRLVSSVLLQGVPQAPPEEPQESPSGLLVAKSQLVVPTPVPK